MQIDSLAAQSGIKLSLQSRICCAMLILIMDSVFLFWFVEYCPGVLGAC